MLLVLIILNILLLIGYLLSRKYAKSAITKKFIKFSFLSFLIISILDITLFNFRFYESLNYQEIIPSDYTLGSGLELQADGSIKQIASTSNYIEFKKINKHLDNIYINLVRGNEENSKVMTISVGYTDAANKRYSYTQERKMYSSFGETYRLHLSGKSSKIRVYVSTQYDTDTFKINQISFNKPVSFESHPERVILIWALCLLIFMFRPKSSLYKMNFQDKKAKTYLILTIVIEILFLGVVSQLNHYYAQEKFNTTYRKQYQLLTESILDGKPYLDIEPGDTLKSLENPYDRKNRDAILEENNEGYIWDTAYYNQKYYVYFGIAPVIFYFLPFYAITHHHMKTSTAIIITAIIATIAIMALLHKMAKKWFPNVSLGHFIMLSLLVINGCGILSIMGRPDHYSLPIIMAIMFTALGLLCYLKATEKEKLDKKYLVLGSLFMALIAASRPQLLLSCFVAIPIFIDYIKKREFLSKKSWKETLCFVIPYVIVAIALMYYNYIRFGSPLDFGANYNLTTNDMTRRGFVLGRTGLGIFYYLFKPLTITLKFPFVMREKVITSYMGTTIFEPMAGGFFMINLITIFSLFIFKCKNNFKDKTPYKMGIICLIAALLIIIADTQMAGILPRYLCDFGIYIYLATTIVIFSILNKKDYDKRLDTILFILFILAVVINMLLLFSDSVLSKSFIFFYVRHIIEFWI